ncbi:FAD dependent oxidoreductase-domain-containing protein [Fusarium sp. MPI-SDFR-AT-0072]|nr:FAD dependent oxidoreductase-domain-containing protein [Fusarium sp. MPI-SDFR-AT-0072]
MTNASRGATIFDHALVVTFVYWSVLKIYQDLGLEAIKSWNSWTEELIHDDAAVPPGMATGDNIWINNGDLSCTDKKTLPPFERATIETKKKGLAPHMQPFAKKLLAVLDTTGGITLADKACRFALHKAKRLGVQFVLDQTAGKVISIVQDSAGRASGISTVDGKTHQAALTIAACGGWTPSLIPELDGFAETTARCVVIFKLPEDLRERFSPSRFPAWSFKITDGAETGLYGFPVDENGLLKIGYRGTKYTNPKLTKIPAQAVKVIRRFTNQYLPELASVDIRLTWLCWYTDSFDNHFIIDHVPKKEGLMVATAGSGHAFKYLPTIGNWVVDIIEGKSLDRPAAKAWRWRSPKEGKAPFNKLMEGSSGDRALSNVQLVSVDALISKL